MYRGERVKSDARVMTPVRLERMSRENVEYWLLHEMHRKAQDVDASLIRQAHLNASLRSQTQIQKKPICPC